MNRRAAIYARISAADIGTSLAAVVADLRRYAAEVRGWTIVLEASDSGPWLHGRRPGLALLADAIRGGQVDVVVTTRLDKLFRSLTHLANLAGTLKANGIDLVATQSVLDTTEPGGRARFLDLVETMNELTRAQRSEAARVARLRSAAKGDGDNWGRPVAQINPLELLGLWVGSPSRVYSTNEIARRLGVSASTTRKYLQELRDAGKLDDAVRAVNLAAAGGLRKGGRPSRSRPVHDAELLSMFQGARPQPLKKIALHYRISRAKLAQHLGRLRTEGRVDDAARAAGMERSR